MVSCQEVYHRLVALTGQAVDIQTLVEHPYIHLLAVGPLSVLAPLHLPQKDWTAFGTNLQAPDGTKIKDILQFCNGEKVVQWTE